MNSLELNLKTCTNCDQTKTINCFGKHKKNRDGLNTECKLCNSSRTLLWQKDNKDKANKKAAKWVSQNKDKRKEVSKRDNDKRKTEKIKTRLVKTYGITFDQYNLMFIEQDGKCKICNKAETGKDKRSGKILSLAVDHCHKTGKVRSLLCGRCNRTLGLFQDSVSLLEESIRYLKKYEY